MEQMIRLAQTLIAESPLSISPSHRAWAPIGREDAARLIQELERLLFPAQFPSRPEAATAAPERVYHLGEFVWHLTFAILRARERVEGQVADAHLEQAFATAIAVAERLPELQRLLWEDVEAAYAGDPAATSREEIIATYPGFYAIMVYRLAHMLHRAHVPLLPRLMTEVAHSQTGIDIHPGAEVGPRFFIDHGTGVVIGETTVIGAGVTLYQGVTLGALNFPHDAEGQIIRGQKRHPTIEDNVVIYSGATILGGDTVIGAGSIIGGNVWLTHSVPPGSKVLAQPQIALRPPRSSDPPARE
ncbi:MAG: serine O-acetyltransferase [Firmicutes bacterium]|nr:serine O-acetyltransferase [Bacillota bacterium]